MMDKTFTGSATRPIDGGKLWERTTALRILRPTLAGSGGWRDRLQQGWYCHETGETEWRDVDIVKIGHDLKVIDR